VLAAATETPFPIAAVPRAKPPPQPGTSASPPTSSGSAGGVAPASVAPEPEPELNGASPQSSSGASSGSAGQGAIAPGQVAPSGQGKSAGAAGNGTGGLGAPPTEPSVSSDEPLRTAEPENAKGGDEGSGGVAIAILTGLLAGCLLFGVGWAARRGWIRWRYGV
jgi:cobalamin biosynthesis Mg chelatase CobN